MKKIVNSPLKILALLTTLLGVAALIVGGYFVFLGFYIVGVGILLYLINYLVTRLVKARNKFRNSQVILSVLYLSLVFWTYMKWQEHNAIIFPNNFKGQAGIIFGIKGYPPLPSTRFWKKRVVIPSNGIIVTSTREDEIPISVRFYYENGKTPANNTIDWDPNFEYSCIVNDTVIKAWLFTFNQKPSLQVERKITELANKINNGEVQSAYTTNNKSIVNDNSGIYLTLFDQNLYFLPDKVANLTIYKAILTGNHFTEIPKQVLNIKSLTDLVMAGNPISVITTDIYRLKRLKHISLNSTNVTDIKVDLSKMDSLEDFDLSSNGISTLPEQIKNLPRLKWLSIHDNKFTDLSFIDSRLQNLETLYLYTNKIKKISLEVKYLSKLKELLIFDNQIDSITNNISSFVNLEKLEIWNNPIRYISPEIEKLKKLKSIRVSDNFLTSQDKKNLKKWLPDCVINYQTEELNK